MPPTLTEQVKALRHEAANAEVELAQGGRPDRFLQGRVTAFSEVLRILADVGRAGQAAPSVEDGGLRAGGASISTEQRDRFALLVGRAGSGGPTLAASPSERERQYVERLEELCATHLDPAEHDDATADVLRSLHRKVFPENYPRPTPEGRTENES